MADESSGDGRNKKALQDILNMTIKLHDSENQELKATPELDPSRKEFLQNAINSVVENDDAKRLVLVTQTFLQIKVNDTFSDEQLENISELFEEINYLLEGLDKGIDFDKLGGVKHCLSLMHSSYSSIQWRAADTIANCAQNMPQVQYSIIEAKGLEVLLYTLKKTDVDMVRVKCLYALSSIIGGNNVAEKLFIDLKGVDTVIKLLADENPKVRLKTAFLIRKIIVSDGETIKFVNDKVAISLKLVDMLMMEHDDSHEAIADMLLQLLEFDENSLIEYKTMNHLSEIFGTRKKELESNDKDRYLELIELYGKLIAKL